MLPVGPTGYGDSPYQSFSTFAGNPYFIDLDLLVDDGLINKEEIDDLISEGKYYGLGKKIDAMKDYNFVNSNSAPEPDIPATDEHSKQEEENLPKVDFNFDDVNWYSALGLDNNKNTSSVENSEIKSTGDNLEEPTEVKIDFN